VPKNQRISEIELDDHVRVRLSPTIEHERRVAIHDLLEDNLFEPIGEFDGPFHVHLSIGERRLIFNIHDEADAPLVSFALPLGEFWPIIKDYFVVCETYFDAIKTLSPSRIEAIDMGRRALHTEGSKLLQERLADRVTMDIDTARRLFTLLCVLHIRP
jgi:uncharacterized protein (UPF0262 family)